MTLSTGDITAVEAYSVLLNTYLEVIKSRLDKNIINTLLYEWSEEHPILFENGLDQEKIEIDVVAILKNLKRTHKKDRLSIVLKEFSILTTRLITVYAHLTSFEHAQKTMADSYWAVKKQYGDAPTLFDILRTMPEGVLDDERLALLSHKELEARIKKRTAELIKINKELELHITKRKKVEEQMEKSLEEKEILLKEIHHRVKNNLQIISSLLNLQSRTIKDGQTLEKFKETQNRIKLMAIFHEKLYQSKNLAEIEFGEYVQSISTSLLRSYGSDSNITLHTEVDDVSLLGVDTAIPCGLIINELVTNSLKYAFPIGRKGEIRIDFHKRENDKFMLTISDNGVGIPKDLDFRNTKSFGLQLVTTLVEQLQGTINLDRSNGTNFKVRFAKVKK